jgi:hypothetical protein
MAQTGLYVNVQLFLLVERRTNINARAMNGKTVLHKVTINRHEETMQALLGKGFLLGSNRGFLQFI